MNWLSNLFGFVRPAAPASKPVMIMSAPPAPPPVKASGDVVKLSRPPAAQLHLTQGAPLKPMLVSNNSTGLRRTQPQPFPPRVTNSAPLIARHGMGLNLSLSALLRLIWRRN